MKSSDTDAARFAYNNHGRKYRQVKLTTSSGLIGLGALLLREGLLSSSQLPSHIGRRQQLWLPSEFYPRLVASTHTPMMMKPIPAMIFRVLGEIKRDTSLPTSTAMRLLKTSASADAANTPKRFRLGSVANNN